MPPAKKTVSPSVAAGKTETKRLKKDEVPAESEIKTSQGPEMQGAAQTKEVKKTTKAKPAKSAKTTKPADSTKSAKMAAATVAKPTGKTAKKTTGKTTGKTTKTAKTAKTTKKSTGRASAKKTASSAGKTLVIVESPSKARTLSGILGKDYVVASSVGHLRDLPRSRMAIDIENNFTPEYILVKGKAKIKNELLSLASTADQVLLASDPDREGEAIAWHLAELLDLDLSQKCRVRFYEITPDAVREAVKAPELVDLRKVNAQQARRILDRLVGYTLSPLLWNKIRYGLSAGRVQSVALSLICEREHEIARFIPEEYWNVTVKARTEDGRSYEMKVDRLDDKRLWKGALPLLIKDQDMAEMLAEEVRNNPIRVTDFRLRSSSRKPQPPFRTSTLQQEAARRLSLSPRRAMRIAQELYEGLNLPGRGHVGLITYMRTDSLRLSEEALSACRSHITSHYGEKYLPPSPNRYAAPGRSQDAHEAIRPTDVTLTPASLKDVLNAEQYRLYDLIWRRFTASQMANAVVANSTLLAEAGRAGMRQLGESLIFEGWSALWPLDLKGTLMEEAKPGEPLLFVSVDKEQKFTRPPSRYSEATLIKTLEEKGVGRPSTYATIVETLYSRGYVERNEERRLSPTGLGMTVDEFLKTHFDRDDISSIVDTNFTAQMEKELDEIEEDKRQWLDVVSDFWDGFSDTVEEARTAERVPLPEPEPIGEDCPECGKPLVKKRGRFGEFIACTGYPDCRYTRAILTKLGVDCPKCSEGDVVKRRSRKGRTFYGCSRYPDCDYVSWNPPTGEKCPDCQTHLVKKGRTVLCPECGYKVQEETVSDV